MTYEGLARGASLEKVVLHVTIPRPTATAARSFADRIVVLEGLAPGDRRSGCGTRAQPGAPAHAVRPEGPHRRALRHPYPYEIVRMLTPAEGDASPFPPGTFQELDLGAGDELVPVDREPGGNTAHVVVGLLTNRTRSTPRG